jgi:hypothetical protein
VWEALHISSKRVGTVSKTHSINIFIPPKEPRGHVATYKLTNSGFKFMKKQFDDNFGIRRIIDFPGLPDGCVKEGL